MKTLALVSLPVLLAAGLFYHPPAAPKPPARSAPLVPRAAWRDTQPKHWRAIVLRKE